MRELIKVLFPIIAVFSILGMGIHQLQKSTLKELDSRENDRKIICKIKDKIVFEKKVYNASPNLSESRFLGGASRAPGLIINYYLVRGSKMQYGFVTINPAWICIYE